MEKEYNITKYFIVNNTKNKTEGVVNNKSNTSKYYSKDLKIVPKYEIPKKFYNILTNSWLQLYDSKNKKDPLIFNNENFHFENKNLIFKVCGSKKRVELRFKEEWKINKNKKIKVKVMLDPKDSEEFTFLQIMSYDLDKGLKYYKPLLRIHWNKKYKGKENHIWAIIFLRKQI